VSNEGKEWNAIEGCWLSCAADDDENKAAGIEIDIVL
jgi:hypothetical protein